MFTVLIILIAIFFYYQTVKYLNYWKRNGVPQYSVAKSLKNNFEIIIQKWSHAQVFHNYCKAFRNHRYFGVYQAFQKCLIIQDPELVKQITIKDFDHFVDHVAFGKDNEPLWDRNLFALKGNEWKDMRSILNTNFTSSKLKAMFGLVQECCEQFVNHFQEQTKDQLHSGVNIRDAYNRFTTDVIATSVFGYKFDSLKNPTNDFYEKSVLLVPKYNDTIGLIKKVLLLHVPKVASLVGATVYAKSGTNFFVNLTKANTQEREKTKVVRNDIIQALMEVKEKNSKIPLDDIDVAAQAVAFLYAGVETVYSTLCFVSYELASNMNIQRRLQMEIDEIIENHEGTITYTAVQDMKYLNMVVSESLRKWSPIYVDRKCSQPYVIPPKNNGEVPVHLKKGDNILFPVREIHRNPDIYPNPDQFDPERFNDENKHKVNPYTYSPFGFGPRTCVAKRFALMEINLLLFYILSKFDFVIVDKTVDPSEFGNLSGLTVTISEYWLGLRPRIR